MGQEFGEYEETTIEPHIIEWNLLKNERNRDLLETYKSLIYLRKNNPALHTANIEFFHEKITGGCFMPRTQEP